MRKHSLGRGYITDKSKMLELYVERGEDNHCWIWTGQLSKYGYGTFIHRGKAMFAHRVAYEITNNVILTPKDFICHKCNTPACCNPNHLYLGTPAENSTDMVKSGRSLKGERNPSAKLTSKQAEEIRQLYIPRKVSMQKLADKFNVSKSAIAYIIYNQHWNPEAYDKERLPDILKSHPYYELELIQ